MFFEPISPEPEERREQPPAPPWIQRPRGVLLGTAPLDLLLARTPAVAIALGQLGACSDGFAATLTVLRAEHEEDEHESPFGWGGWRRRAGEDPETLLRFGVRYADGNEAELGARKSDGAGRPDAPVIRQGGGSGGGGEWDQRLWFWPLPPPGRITFAVEWRAQRLELVLHELDAEPIRAAAARSQRVFPAAAQQGGSVVSASHAVRDSR